MAISKKTKPEEQVKAPSKANTTETLTLKPKQPEGPSKAEKAMKIMESAWKDIQSGKVKRKDIIQRFIDDVGLTKAGASTYYGNIKKKLSKVA